MEILTLPTAEAACVRAAEIVAQAVVVRPEAALGLPTGRTPVPIYAELVRRRRAGGLRLGAVRAFGLDELWGVPASAPASFRRELDGAFYRHVDIVAANIYALDGAAADATAEAAAYEAALGRAGGLDLALLGIGGNGHIAFNEPGSPFASRTRLGKLLQCAAASHHQGDNDGGEVLTQRERAGDRKQRDDVDAQHAAAQAAHQIGQHDQRDQRG